MRLLWLVLLVPAAVAQAGFGTSYLKNSRLCHEWSCLNTKLGLPDSLPPQALLTAVLKARLPKGSWQSVVDDVIGVCYGDRPRRYTNTCPGQAVLHCVVDQLIHFCPEEYQWKSDSCSPVSSLAGIKFMFSQSRYSDLENNLTKERRPAWFLKNYFSSKCCNLPELFDSAQLAQCGINEFMHYYMHTPQYDHLGSQPHEPPQHPKESASLLHVVDFNDVSTSTTPSPRAGEKVWFVDSNVTDISPLECCDVSEFIAPSWPTECNVRLSWDARKRLVVNDDVTIPATPLTTTPLATTRKSRDRMLVPLSCEKETCIFQKLNVVDDRGSVDIAAFTKLLDNFTDVHELWRKAKARVVTSCLKRPLVDYEADCEINKILACTLDVLTENCPYSRKSDICKHSREDIVCQISSSKYRAKNRRSTCFLPDIVHPDYLSQCGVTSLSRVQHVTEASRSINLPMWPIMKTACKELTPSMSCLMKKMSVMNKYGFMDYFLMKDRIRMTSERAWQGLSDVIISAFVNAPLYKEHCSSAKKILNVLDTMMMTCPASRRKDTTQCKKLFNEISNTAPENNLTQEKLQQILKHFQHVYLPNVHPPNIHLGRPRPKTRREKVVKTPIFNFGILGSQDAPKVSILDLKTTTRRPAAGVLLPVYARTPIFRKNYIFTPYRYTPMLRTAPLWTRPQIPTPAVPNMFNGPLGPVSSSVSTPNSALEASTPVSTSSKTSDATEVPSLSKASVVQENVFDDSALDRAEKM